MGKSKKFHSQLTKPSKQSGSGSTKKGKLQGSQNMFKVKANKAHKSKRKTKAVTSNLTRIMDQRKSHTLTSDRAYTDLQDTLHRSKVTEKRKQISSNSLENKVAVQRTIKDDKSNIDATMEQFATLW
ncbi:hypothetical protein HOLleu_13094 [Holothuria leucospilota]|uniref:Uncharacterized protein n=1 Tax=Holothuria leucospilota TaxID=206669 RepID=A0A9Q1CBA2_HOLLE|nr:hypothetical protein HOLleu_13094 [Holothuria leucospilota]